MPINKGCTQVEGPEPMSSWVIIPVGGFSRGFYFTGFGGWSAALALGPLWSFLGMLAPLFLLPPNTFNRSPSCPIQSLISCRACLRGLVHCCHRWPWSLQLKQAPKKVSDWSTLRMAQQ